MEEHHDIEVNYIEGDDVTQDVTQGESQGGIQGVLQDGELDDWIEKQTLIPQHYNLTLFISS